MKIVLSLFLLALTCAQPAQAMDQLELEGENRIVNIYKAREIPKYLRSDQCTAYAYKQKFPNTIVDGKIQDGEENAVGTHPGDLQMLQENDICLLLLQKEGMLKGEKKPVTFYEIKTFKDGPNEIRVGENHQPMDDGKYELENGMTFTVENGVLAPQHPTP
jgi:hypothetical protein